MDPIEPITYIASTSVSTTLPLPTVGIDIFAVLGSLFADFSFSGDGIIGFLSSLWSIITVIAYILSIIFLVLYIYASIRKNLYLELQSEILRDAEHVWDQQYRGESKNSRLEDVLNHSTSENPNDWKLAIIEADIILDDLLKQRGYGGNSLGERLKSISPNQLASLNDAWEAHKIRNRIAHDGADFILTQRLAQETITRYNLVFTELGLT